MTPSTPAGGAVAITFDELLSQQSPEVRAAVDARYVELHAEHLEVASRRHSDPLIGEAAALLRRAYSQPPATVPVEAVLALVGKWRREVDELEATGLAKYEAVAYAVNECADELESLTRGEK